MNHKSFLRNIYCFKWYIFLFSCKEMPFFLPYSFKVFHTCIPCIKQNEFWIKTTFFGLINHIAKMVILRFVVFRSSICIQLLLFHNNQNNVYPHFFLVTLEFLELSCRDNIKRNQGEIWTFPPKTPTLYQWTTQLSKT